MTEWVGRTLGKVQIESLIARGGVAEVYLGTHTTLQRKVAVKILREQYQDDPDLLERFQREAVVVSRLRHPNIVQIYDFDAVAGHPYLVMEYISGPSLSRYLDVFHAKGKRLELPVISRLLTSVASALAYAHKMGVIHRDVKPGNILLTSHTAQVIAGITMPAGFEPILTDFGLVRFLNSSRHTTNGQITGTPAYMSPEQARGEATDERTDIYSLGIVLYEMLSGGRVPFEGETTMSVLLKHIHHPVEPIPGLSPSLQEILDLALAKDRHNRYSSSTRFASDFRSTVEQLSRVDTYAPESPVYRPPKISEKPRVRWRRAAALAILGLAIGSFLWFGRIPTQEAGIIPNTGDTAPSTTLPSQAAPVELSPSTVLRFRNGIGIADQAELIAESMPLPPDGSQYEAWLIGGGARQSLGVLELDEQGNGRLIYSDRDGENLIGLYDRVELSIESMTDEEPGLPAEVVYAFAPGEGYIHLRNLLSSSPDTPNEISIFQGLITTIHSIQQNAADMKTEYENSDEPGMRQKAEAIMILLAGNQSPDYKDWDGDGERVDPFDGYGLLPNGSQPGYIQALSSEGDYAANAPGATVNLISHWENARICTQNLSTWATSLRQTTLRILSAPSGSNLDGQIADSGRFASQLMNGTDLDGDQTVELLPGGCGATSVLENTYRMADMYLMPINLIPIATEVSSTRTPSSTPAQSE
jgi:serine/threonine protein kinase